MKKKNKLLIAFKVLSIMLVFIILASVCGFFILTKDVKLDKNALESNFTPLKIYDAAGEETPYAAVMPREVSFRELSPQIVNAFVALEDKRFFKHKGVDFIRLGGAAKNNIKAGKIVEGGSTITQQLAKNALLTGEKTYERKLKEARLAAQIEKNYSKEEILAMYLERIYYGAGMYGIYAACEGLFDKLPAEVTASEAAILAGIVKNPSAYSPVNSIENAFKRRDLVLKLMREQNYLSEEQYNSAIQERYSIPEKKTVESGGVYAAAVIAEAAAILGKKEKEILTGGYSIYTFSDPALMKTVDKAFESGSFDCGTDYTVLLADNKTGGISAYRSTSRACPLTFRRQPASAIKPIAVYAPAIERNIICPASPIADIRQDFNGYVPKNYKNSYLGWTTVREALVTSSNVAAVQILDETGISEARKTAQKMGVPLSESDGLSTALGGLTNGLTALELTEAYMTIANQGMHGEIGFIKSIYDANGKKLYEKSLSKERALTAETSYLLTDMLMDCADRGTAKKMKTDDYQIAAKTGTAGIDSGANSDAWNLSFTSDVTLCSWYGNSDGSPMSADITGGSYPTLIAAYIHSRIPRPADFQKPDGVTLAETDLFVAKEEHTLRLASDFTPAAYRKSELFSKSCLPRPSDYFDKLIPSDIEVAQYEEGATISFTTDKGVIYKVYARGALIGTIVGGDEEYAELWDLNLEDGVNLYTVQVYTDEEIFVAESTPKALIYFSYW